ncbi:MAG: GtrA family protein [Dehalococcoidales bacterium]|nr:GtrA family protein [Dehalococcoidales bacterium]
MISSIKKWKIVVYARQRIWKIGKFLVVGGSAALLTLLILYVLVDHLGFNTKLGENVANLIGMELGIIYNYFMMRAITWQDIPKEAGKNLFIQILKFHAALIMTTLLRLILFALLQFLNVYYIINAAIGILLVAALNFIAYDTMIFKDNG